MEFNLPYKMIRIVLLAVLVVFFCGAIRAQPGNPTYSLSTNTFFEVDMRPIALVDVETNAASINFSMDVPAPTEAGRGLQANPVASYTSNWLNYSCAVPSVISRNVQASIDYGTVPAGFELRITTGAATGGAGTLGTPAPGAVTLTSSPQNIVTNIRGAYTGDGPANGHQLTFELYWMGGSFSILEYKAATIGIIYTIIDN